MFLNFLFEKYGGKKAIYQKVDNDKLQIFDLLLTVDKTKYMLERLSEGIKDMNQLDDSTYSIKEMLQTLVLDNNKENLHTNLPNDTEELDDYFTLDTNG